ncbi:MAG: hypothetical protein HY221_02205 [Candidatus Sungbacteria bacterium]|uniref:Uncharacterized protein n=1 Tax=Candidatus Sungiibacteriota bacterium TaxID=2750080 RepID=A0A932QYE3_9BACT|nr:hypothetical protein [Candidatus Sungbacteria bacterium]
MQDNVIADIEGNFTQYCSGGVTGLLKITGIVQPGTTQTRNVAQGSLTVNNPGSVVYYAYPQCDFKSGSAKISSAGYCVRINPGATLTMNPYVILNTTGTWSMQCKLYASLSSDCSAANVHDTSSSVSFDTFSNDIYVKDVSGSCNQGAVGCVVRTSKEDSCVQCYLNNNPCTLVNQTGDKSLFSCNYVPGNFTLTGKVTSSQTCTPVDPISKSIVTRCAICGDGIVDKNIGEQCEPPNTDNNHYVTQTSGVLCSGRQSGIRDAFGYCNSQCRAVPDNASFSCNAGVCGAECSPGQVRAVIVEKQEGSCQCLQQCDVNSCTFNSCDCTP